MAAHDRPLAILREDQLQELNLLLLSQLALVRGRVYRHLYSEAALKCDQGTINAAIKILNTQLSRWKDRNAFILAEPCTRRLEVFVITQQLSYYNTLILINQRYLLWDEDDPGTRIERPMIVELCTSAAWESIEIVSRLPWWSLDYTGFVVS
jgi:hypothetical protein